MENNWFILVASFIIFLSPFRFASAVDCEVSLPQHASPKCAAIRNDTLNKLKETYTMKPSQYGFVLLNMTISELGAVALKDPFISYYVRAYVGMTQTNNQILAKYNNATAGQEITGLSDYLEMSEFFQTVLEPVLGEYVRSASRHEAFIDDKTQWISDKFFAQQRLAGNNPLTIRRVTMKGCAAKTIQGACCRFPFKYRGKVYRQCTRVGSHRPWCFTAAKKWGKRRKWGYCAEQEPEISGLDFGILKKTMNLDFDWDGAVRAALGTGGSLEDAIKQGRIYALRYELCDDLGRAPDLTERDPQREMWNFLSPIAFFASKTVRGKRNEFVPVAIQMDHPPESAVYTPADGDNWLLAKLNVQITDIGYAQITEHLAKIHFFVEPFCVSLKRTLPPMHPLNQMLKYHCREVTIPNTFGTPVLLGDTGFAALLFAYGKEGALKLIRDVHPLTSWEITDYRENIKKRGMFDKNLLPYYPFRDDGLVILKVIEDLVRSYIDLYYRSDQNVKEDVELQAYLNEVSLVGTGPNGGIGQIKGLPPSVDSKRELCEILSRFISHLTIYHASVNYVTTDYPEYIPNQPTKLYNDSRVEDGQFSFLRLPNRAASAIQSAAFNSLGSFRFDSLFDYGNELDDTKAANLVNAYYCRLMDKVQPYLQARNRLREKNGYLAYPYFIPKWLPNGIQT